MMVASCPTCHGQVTVPPRAELDVRVRCPLCGEEYPLAEAVGDLPPMLIVVDDSTVGSEPRGEAPQPEPLPAVGSRGTSSIGVVPTVAEDAVAEDNDRPNTAQSEQVDAPLVFPPKRGDGATSTDTMAKKAHAKRRQKTMAGEMIQIVGGGVAAVVLFHAIFWWGLHRDPLRLAPKLPAFMAFLAPAELSGLPRAADPSGDD